MSYARQLVDIYPGTLNADAGVLAAILDVLSDCAEACAAEADAAVAEQELAEQDLAEIIKCIRLCLDCTDVRTTTLRGRQLATRCRRAVRQGRYGQRRLVSPSGRAGIRGPGW